MRNLNLRRVITVRIHFIIQLILLIKNALRIATLSLFDSCS
jgi:hypothetical protein